MTNNAAANRVAFYTPNLKGGGAERMMLILAGAFAAAGYRVDFLVDETKGALVDQVPAGVQLRELGPSPRHRGALTLLRDGRDERPLIVGRVLTSTKALAKLRRLPALAAYLQTELPTVIVCALGYAPLLARWARNVADSPTRVIARQDNSLSAKLEDSRIGRGKRRQRARLRNLMARLYPKMDAVVAVSDGVRSDLASTLGMSPSAIQRIYNPVIAEQIETTRQQPADHPWLANAERPVILAVGRLNVQKGFDVLIDAFVPVRGAVDARLVIIGEGPERAALEARISWLGLGEHIDLPGWLPNPYALMAAASVFVLSSRYEGLPTALIEAMACGCPVVATDCPSGPREILNAGRLGRLVATDNPEALANAIIDAVRTRPDTAETRRRAHDFTVAASLAGYRTLIDNQRAAPAAVSFKATH